MNVQIEESWKAHLKPEFDKDYFRTLTDYQITKGEWYVREVLWVDEDNRQIYFSANGMEAGEDPYFIRYYRIGFDGKGLTCLTPEEGMHRAWFSGDMKYLVDVYSMVDKVPVAVLRSARDGKVVMPLETADITLLEAEGWKAPEVFVAKGRDGKTKSCTKRISK